MTALDDAFQQLIDRSHEIVGANPNTLTLSLAGRRIRLIAAGPAMLSFVGPAFAHLPRLADDVPADLTVYLWDSETTGGTYPDLPLPPVEQAALGVVTSDDIVASYSSVERSIRILRRSTNEAFVVADRVDTIPWWERLAPLRNLLSWWFVGQGMLLAHTAAVSTADGAALLIGPGGSGKSSTALACLAAGLGYLGDDNVIIDPESRKVWSVYTSAKLVAEHHDRYPHLMTTDSTDADKPGFAKQIGWPGVEFADRVVLRADIRALVLPIVTGGSHCRMLPSTTGRALLALAPTTMYQALTLQQRVFELASQTVQPFQPYWLELGGHAEQLPVMLSVLIAEGQC